jgi:cell division septation protein DedD
MSGKMSKNRLVPVMCCVLLLGLSACSRQQSDWQKTRETNTADSYEQFLKKYPSGEFTAQAQARLKELVEERDWQKARDADTSDAYQAFLKQYPEGKWAEEARIRIENFTLAQTPGSGAGGAPANSADNATPPVSGAAPVAPPAKVAPAAKPPTAAPSSPPAAPSPPPRAAEPSKSSGGNYAVQLGAFKSGEGAANKHWARLQKENPKLLAGLSSKVLPKKTSKGTLYRLQAVGMSEKRARKVCEQLKAKSQSCVVIRPAHR